MSEEIEWRVCSKCGERKELCGENYYIYKTGKWYSECKKCKNKSNSVNGKKKKRNRNEYAREQRKKNKQRYNEYDRKRYQKRKNDPRFLESLKNYRKNNKEKISLLSKKYYDSIKNTNEYKYNRGIYLKNYNKREKSVKRRLSIKYKLRSNLSRHINRFLEKVGGSKNGDSCLKYLPYTIEELKLHIESQFESWMTWENHGMYNSKTWNDNDSSTWKWQIDHIIPHSFFNYTSMDSEGFRKCWALENLRPYSAKQNLIDGNRRPAEKVAA